MKTIDIARWALAIAALSATAGCSFMMRNPEQYRDDTTKLLANRSADLDTCYDTVIATSPTAAGKVTVTFSVEEKTGKISDAKADPARTTAPQPLIDCVTTAINGLALAPADQHKGIATFEYNFARPAVPAAAPANPAAAK
jgi:hypothetical protein